MTWTPDGRKAVFIAFPAQSGVGELILLDIETGTHEVLPPLPRSAGNPEVSPDGKRVIFDAHADDEIDSGDGRWEIWMRPLRGGAITRLTNNAVDDWGPRWSSDGRTIVFMGGGLNNTNYDVYVMNADGTSPRAVTRH